jgi:nucleoside-diphosphate-sugar epimerase
VGFWEKRRVLVTGGASFIGSHLVEALVERGAEVRVADDFSSGRIPNLADVLGDVDVRRGDLRRESFAAQACRGVDAVFHLAADHGGRGYVDLHQAACATNLALDQTVFTACLAGGIGKLIYASSGCIYPLHLQNGMVREAYLTEDMAGPPYDPDGLYGLAKLAGELTLRAIHREHGLPSTSCRLFTVYGPRGVENHAVMAMVGRAFIRQDPFVVWGTGEQIRNWTYVSDIVSGMLRAGEVVEDGSPVNLGTMERVRVMDAVRLVLEYTSHDPEIETRPEMPVGPLNRVADNTRARQVLGWEPQVPFAEGLRRTVNWYFATQDRGQVAASLEALLTERPGVATSRFAWASGVAARGA